MMNFLKDWIIQYRNKFSVGGVETTIDRVTGTVLQEGDTIKAYYLNEIQKNCIYQVKATRVIEGVLEIYDISIDGSEDFTPFNQTFLIDFDVTNTRVDSLLRFNGITYSLRFSDSVTNVDIAPSVGFIPKRAVVKLDVSNSKAIIIDDRTIIQSLLDLKSNLASPAFTGTPTTPTPTSGDNSTKIATTAWVRNAMETIMTALGFVFSSNSEGYMKFPTCLGSLKIVWGTTSAVSGTTTETFPLAFTSWVVPVLTGVYDTSLSDSIHINGYTLTTLTMRQSNGVNASGRYIALGI